MTCLVSVLCFYPMSGPRNRRPSKTFSLLRKERRKKKKTVDDPFIFSASKRLSPKVLIVTMSQCVYELLSSSICMCMLVITFSLAPASHSIYHALLPKNKFGPPGRRRKKKSLSFFSVFVLLWLCGCVRVWMSNFCLWCRELFGPCFLYMLFLYCIYRHLVANCCNVAMFLVSVFFLLFFVFFYVGSRDKVVELNTHTHTHQLQTENSPLGCLASDKKRQTTFTWKKHTKPKSYYVVYFVNVKHN